MMDINDVVVDNVDDVCNVDEDVDDVCDVDEVDVDDIDDVYIEDLDWVVVDEVKGKFGSSSLGNNLAGAFGRKNLENEDWETVTD